MSRTTSCLDRRLPRRKLLKLGLAGLLGGLMPSAIRTVRLLGAPAPSARALVVLWMAGGPSHIDTFDPKPGAATGGPFKTLPTPVEGLHFTEHLPRLAEMADRLAVVRSMTSAEGSHGRGTYYLHTGYSPNPTVRNPSLGAMMSHEQNDPDYPLPGFVSLGGPSMGGGFLGQQYDPFVVTSSPGRKVDFLDRQPGMTDTRLSGRLDLAEAMNRSFADAGAGSAAEAQTDLLRRAHRMMVSPLTRAFEIGQESRATREAYGEGDFGQRCLMARRLLETGMPAVEVTLGGWDTHEDNFTRTQALMEQLDPALSALLRDLEDREMLSWTLVVCIGEFGRRPRINPREGRDHHPRAFSAVLAGGGIKSGTVVGATDPEGETVVDRPVRVPDLFATLCRLLGVDGDRLYMAGERPVTLVNKGQVVQELIA